MNELEANSKFRALSMAAHDKIKKMRLSKIDDVEKSAKEVISYIDRLSEFYVTNVKQYGSQYFEALCDNMNFVKAKIEKEFITPEIIIAS